ncbi:hypothetical protein AHF37_10353 [Paragonimus kellicotti]|nr:hypothetical protein AHF37_10353 [Paragonimus kellicotti]
MDAFSFWIECLLGRIEENIRTTLNHSSSLISYNVYHNEHVPPILIDSSISISTGSFYDVFRNFDFTFIFGGVALFASGLLCFPLATVARWERRKELAGTDADPENEDDFLPSDTTRLRRIIRKLWNNCMKHCCCRHTRVGYDPTEMDQKDIDVRIDQIPGAQSTLTNPE